MKTILLNETVPRNWFVSYSPLPHPENQSRKYLYWFFTLSTVKYGPQFLTASEKKIVCTFFFIHTRIIMSVGTYFALFRTLDHFILILKVTRGENSLLLNGNYIRVVYHFNRIEKHWCKKIIATTILPKIAALKN